jgi:hypothetical protein
MCACVCEMYIRVCVCVNVCIFINTQTNIHRYTHYIRTKTLWAKVINSCPKKNVSKEKYLPKNLLMKKKFN